MSGDFNLSTLLSMSTSAYDGFYNLLSPEEKQLLLDNIRRIGDKFYNEYVNHLENRIADNHVWQITFRILTMAAFATVGEIPEASVWTDYCYNEWISRLPGLHKDGGWHNGDAYFHVNIRTLIEVPASSLSTILRLSRMRADLRCTMLVNVTTFVVSISS